MSTDTHIGLVLEGRYRIERLLGKGGMGAVYEGHHVVVGKRVAIKLLHAEFAQHEEVLKRFYREAQAAAAIGHPNIIDISDVGITPTNEPYLVMEYLEGEDLESMLERTGPVSIEAACGILEMVIRALAAAHAKGIVHRDLKPANIFLARGANGLPVVKLIDFGISKFSGGGGSTKLTQTGSLLGTPAYMAPEQARGEPDVNHRADIYAIGVILYQMLTGKLPFTGDNYNTLLINVLTEPPRPLREHNPAILPEVEALVLRQLSKHPDGRSQTVEGLLAELTALSAFAERDSGLSIIGTQLRDGVAGGNLGERTGRSRSGSKASASKVLSDLARGTPGAWAATQNQQPAPGRVVGLVVGLSVVVLALVAVVLWLVFGRAASSTTVSVPAAHPISAAAAQPAPSPRPPAAPVPAPAPAMERGVEIRLVGLPAGAKITYGDMPVPENPFRVDRKETMTSLRVEAEGFEPWIAAVVPSENRELAVVMVEKARNSNRRTVRDRVEPAAAATAPAPARTVEADKFKDGKRGTKIGSDFE